MSVVFLVLINSLSLNVQASTKNTYYVQQTSILYSDSTSSKKKLVSIPINTKLQSSTNKSKKMFKVSYKGQEGYIYASRVSKNPVQVTKYTKENTILYPRLNDKPLNINVPVNTKVSTISPQSDTYFLVTYTDKNKKRITGYIAAKNLSNSKVKVPNQNQNIVNYNYDQTTNWTREQAARITYNNPNRLVPKPDFSNGKALSSKYRLWDNWSLLTESGDVAKVGGWYVYFVLGERNDGPGESARIYYFYSKNGKDNWIEGGTVTPETFDHTKQEWSGSAIVGSDNKLHLFYTSSSFVYPGLYDQNIVTTVMNIEVNGSGVKFNSDGKAKQTLLAKADGKLYETVYQSLDYQNTHGIPQKYAFRDPFFFSDPKTGKKYLIFEGNTGESAGELVQQKYFGNKFYYENHKHDILPNNAESANASIGILELNDDFTKAKLLPPLLASNLVTDETERPSMVYKNGRYYLFTTSHGWLNQDFNNNMHSYDSLHGFTSQNLFGPYSPVNDDGVVLAGTSTGGDLNYTYAWGVQKNGLVLSFADNSTIDNQIVAKRDAAPSLKLKFNEDSVTLMKTKLKPAQVVE